VQMLMVPFFTATPKELSKQYLNAVAR